jgi:hypothetical protein
MTQQRLITSAKAGGAALLALSVIGLAGLGLRSALAREMPRCAYVYLDTNMDAQVTLGVDEDLSADQHFELVVTNSMDRLVYRGSAEDCRIAREDANSRLALTIVYGYEYVMQRPVQFVQIPASVYDASPAVFLVRENPQR